MGFQINFKYEYNLAEFKNKLVLLIFGERCILLVLCRFEPRYPVEQRQLIYIITYSVQQAIHYYYYYQMKISSFTMVNDLLNWPIEKIVVNFNWKLQRTAI